MQFTLTRVVVIALVTLALASLTACGPDVQPAQVSAGPEAQATQVSASPDARATQVSASPDARATQVNAGLDVRYIQVTAGRYLTCALRSDGSVVCWGEDSSTQLRVPAEERFTAIETGGYHTCGLREDGTAVCWSDYDLNALSRAGKILPFPPEDEPFSAIEVSQDLTCAVRMDGTSSCWDLWQEFSPLGMEKVVAIGAAIQAACGLRSDGRLVCSNSYLADHFKGEELVSISTSQSILCGLGSDGSVSCLALSDLVLAEEGPFSAVAASLHQVCALRQEGTVVCWELYPSLIGTTISPWLIDAPLADSLEDERFTAISAGLWHVCGLRRDGGISCWGFDNEGQALPPLDYSEFRP